MLKLVLQKAEEPEIKLPTSAGSLKEQESSRKQNKTKQNKNKQTNKNICFCFIDYAKAFKCVDHNKQLKFWKIWDYQTTWPDSWETYMQVR